MSEKFSWNQCTEFATFAQAFLKRTKDKETKLNYAINRVLGRIQKQSGKVNDALSDIEIDNCVTEKRGDDDVIVRDGQGNLQFTKEGIRKRNAATTKYVTEANVEVEPYFATKLPDDLSTFEVEAFAGFVIKPEEVEGLLTAIEARGDAVADSEGDHHAAGASA